MPDLAAQPPRAPHGIADRLLLALVALHAGAALWHHLVRRDATLRRMLSGPPRSDTAPRRQAPGS